MSPFSTLKCRYCVPLKVSKRAHTHTHTHTRCRCLECLNKFCFVWLPQALAFITLIQSRAVSILQHSVGGNEVKFDRTNELGHWGTEWQLR
jgi:hypothetical protein